VEVVVTEAIARMHANPDDVEHVVDAALADGANVVTTSHLARLVTNLA
jgi:hypothetical protein